MWEKQPQFSQKKHTTLIINIFLGPFNISVNFNERLFIDATQGSYDPDVDPALPHELNFHWACRKVNEVCN